jgi:hypothetical protein
MHFEDQFVAHSEVDIDKKAVGEISRPERNVIYPGTGKYAIVETAINKSNSEECAGRKVAIGKNASFKLRKIRLVYREADAVISRFRNVLGHSCEINAFCKKAAE